MIDADLKPWLIEINSSPDFSYSTPVTETLVRCVSEDTVKVVVDYAAWEAARASARAEARAAAKRAAAAADASSISQSHHGRAMGRGTKPFTVVSARGARSAAEVVLARPTPTMAPEAATEASDEALVTSYPHEPPKPCTLIDTATSPEAPSASSSASSVIAATVPPPDTGGWKCIFKSTVVAGSLTCTAHDIMVFGTAVKRPLSAAAKKASSQRKPREGQALAVGASAEEHTEFRDMHKGSEIENASDIQASLRVPRSAATEVDVAETSVAPSHVPAVSRIPRLQPSTISCPDPPGVTPVELKVDQQRLSLGSMRPPLGLSARDGPKSGLLRNPSAGAALSSGSATSKAPLRMGVAELSLGCFPAQDLPAAVGQHHDKRDPSRGSRSGGGASTSRRERSTSRTRADSSSSRVA